MLLGCWAGPHPVHQEHLAHHWCCINSIQLLPAMASLTSQLDAASASLLLCLLAGQPQSCQSAAVVYWCCGIHTEQAILDYVFQRVAHDVAGAVVTGSHCDAIPHAGMYDGTVGVLGAIAAVKGLQKANFKPKRPIEVLFFTSEEPTRFGFGCIGRYAHAPFLPFRQQCSLLTAV